MTKAHKRRRFGRIVLATQDAKMEILDKEVAKVAQSWQDKIVIDVTNAYGVPPEKLGNLPSSVVISQALPGASLLKAFNHLGAATLAQDPRSMANAAWCSSQVTTIVLVTKLRN